MESRSVQEKKVDKRTISSETKKIFLLVFGILMVVGAFTVFATYEGRRVFKDIKDMQIPQFQYAGDLQRNTLDIIGIYYLLSGENDLELQMNQMWRYDDLAKSFQENLQMIEKSVAEMDSKESGDKILVLVNNIKNVFERINQNARDMMLNNMNGDRDIGKTYFTKVVKDIGVFREEVGALEEVINSELEAGTSSALSLLSKSSIIGIIVSILSAGITYLLIRYLMGFLSVSLLPISNLMHNLRQSVFSIDKAGTVVSPVSKYSETLFQNDIVGDTIDNLVLDHLGKTSESYAAAKTAITSVFGEDDLQWSLMEDNFPPMVSRMVGSDEKFIKLSYTPLFNKEEIVQNVMVVAEDVTELEKTKKDASKKQAEIKIIQGLIGVDRGDLEAFFSDAIAGINQCVDLVQAMPEDFETRKLIFRILHTIKGNSRLYNLMALSEVIHIAENAVVEINTRLDANEPVGSEHYASFLVGLRDTNEVLAAHTKVTETLFGIKNSLLEERVELLHELMGFVEWGAPHRSSGVFDKNALLAAGVETQRALANIDAAWIDNVERIQKLASYLESQDIHDAAEKLMADSRSEGKEIDGALAGLQNAYYRYFLQHPSKAYDFGFDDILPIISGRNQLKQILAKGQIAQASEETLAELRATVFSMYKCAESLKLNAIKQLTQKMLLAAASKDGDQFVEHYREAWTQIAWIFHLDATFSIDDDQRGDLSAALEKFTTNNDIESLEAFEDSDALIMNLTHSPNISDVKPAVILKSLSKKLSMGGTKEEVGQLAGSENTKDWIASYMENAKSGLATPESIESYQKFVAEISWDQMTHLMNNALQFTGLRVDLLRLASKFVAGDGLASSEEESQTYEVSSKWYDKVTDLVDMLEYSSKRESNQIREELQDLLASVFDYPLQALCKKMEPMMRDLTMKLGKNINYVVSGDTVALPREQAYALRDALVHMLRNSLDHGIEVPSVRATRGKTEFATIEIHCSENEDGSMEIQVRDDGNGINVDKVKEKAVSINAISQETADSMTDQDAVQLIFLSRLSTKTEVSSLSGRGVGMDAVKSIVVNRMKGSIDVETTPEVGTLFTLKVAKGKRSGGAQSAAGEMISFLGSSSKSIAECADMVASIATDKAVGESVFRTLHTVKGNATMLNLKTIADLIHATETTVSEVIQASEEGKPTAQDVLTQLEEKIKNIRNILLAELKQREAKSGNKGQVDAKTVFLKECFHTVRDMMESVYKDTWDIDRGRAAFRDLHTMKGSASMNNLGKVVDAIHVCESALDRACSEMEQGSSSAESSMSEFKSLLEAVQETITADLKQRMQGSKSRKKGAASESQMLAENLASWLEGIVGCDDQEFHKKSFVDDVFREMHTNKGNAELLSMKALVSQIHACEELVTQWGDCLNSEGAPDGQVLTNLKNSMGNLITACKASSGPKKKETAKQDDDLKMAS